MSKSHETGRSAKAPKPRPELKDTAKPKPQAADAQRISSAENTEGRGRSHGTRKSDQG